MCSTLGHAAASAARAEASAFAGEGNQPIGTAARTPKPDKPIREHAAANESLKLTLDEQGGATLFVVSVELPKEGLEVLAYDAVQHSALRGAAYVGSRDRLARNSSV